MERIEIYNSESLIVGEYTKDLFKNTIPFSGQAILLFEDSEEVDFQNWTGSADLEDVPVIKSGVEYTVSGIVVSTLDSKGNSNLLNLKTCDQITLFVGQDQIHLPLDTSTRYVWTNYAYYDVLGDRGTPGKKVKFSQDITASFQKVSIGDRTYKFVDYECLLGDQEEGSQLTLYPVFGLKYENSDYNPLLNNVTGSVLNKYVRDVEVIRKYVPGQVVPASLDIPTTPAAIPDSFYTSIQNISGRFLGSKNSTYTNYIGDKIAFSRRNLEVFEKPSTARYRDLSFFNLQGFTGSVFPGGTTDEAIKSLTKSEMILDLLSYSVTASYLAKNTADTGSLYSEQIFVPHMISTKFEKDDLGETVVVESNLPRGGTILYRTPKERLTNVRVYSPDLGAVMSTDDYGIVTKITTIQVAD